MRTVISRDGTRIAYDRSGNGPVLIYITGALCHRSMREVRRDVRAFSDRFSVISYDRRGRGDSGLGTPWSLERELDDLEALLDAVDERAVLYGHSSGAVLALHAAQRFSQRIDAAALYDASWVADPDEARSYAELRTKVEDLLERGRHPAAIRRFLLGIGMPRVFAALLPVMPGWSTMKRLAPTLRYDMALTAVPPPLDVAAAISTPVHVLVGGRSPRELHTVAHALAGARGDEPTVVLGQDHLVNPRAILPLLTERLLCSGERS